MTSLEGAESVVLLLRLGFAASLYLFVALAILALRRALGDGGAPAGVQARLVLVRASGPDDEVGRTVSLRGDSVSVGRLHDNDVVVRDDGVSARHARFDGARDGWSVSDAGSRNGTTVNGLALERATRLADGDEVGMGGLAWRYEVLPAGKASR